MFMRPIRVSVHKFISAKARSYVRGRSLRVYEQSSEAHGRRQWRCRADVVFGQSIIQCLDSRWRGCWWYAVGIRAKLLPNKRSGSALRVVPAGTPGRAGLCLRCNPGGGGTGSTGMMCTPRI